MKQLRRWLTPIGQTQQVNEVRGEASNLNLTKLAPLSGECR